MVAVLAFFSFSKNLLYAILELPMKSLPVQLEPSNITPSVSA